MLFRGKFIDFILQHFQGLIQVLASVSRMNDAINVAKLRCAERVCKCLSVLLHKTGFFRYRILGFCECMAMNNIHGAIGTHYGNLCCRVR